MAKKIDPLNKKQYGAVSAMLTVSDIPTAVSFYQKAFGFSKRAVMNGPDGKPIHAEVTLRGTTLMLGPENPALGKRTAKTIGDPMWICLESFELQCRISVCSCGSNRTELSILNDGIFPRLARLRIVMRDMLSISASSSAVKAWGMPLMRDARLLS